MKNKKKLLLLLTALFLAYSFSPQAVQAKEIANNNQSQQSTILPIQLLGTNDFHGALSEAPSLAGHLNQEKDAFMSQSPNGISLRIQAGDMVGSSPVNSSLLQDEPTIKVMNQMNFDYGTLGNHEFDEGLAEFNRILTGTAPEKGQFNLETETYPREASAQQMLIANVLQKSDHTIPYNWKPYAIKELTVNQNKIRIGLIGIVTKNIPNLVSKKYHEEYTFLDEAETIAKYSQELREQGVQAIVVIAHTGHGEAIINKLNQIAPDHSVDIFFDGHSHKEVNTAVGNTRIVQSLSSGRAFSSVDGEIDSETNDFRTTPAAKILHVNKTIAKDPTVETIVTDADQRTDSLSNQTISYAISTASISKKDNRFKESALGNLVADAQLTIANKEGFSVDGALVNNGSLRADLIVNPDKTISYGNAHRVQPFNNPLYVVQLSGQQLTDILNKQYQNNQKNPLQIAGISYQYTNTTTNAQPYLVTKMKKKNTALTLQQTVTVVVNEYIYNSDFFSSIFSKGKLLGVLKANDTEAFIQYLNDQKEQKISINAKIDNRKQYTPFNPNTEFKYRTHVQDHGWKPYVTSGKTSGTVGQSKRLEGIQIKIDSTIDGKVQYKTHIQDYGWQGWKENNALSGTTGKSKRLEAIQIKLNGAIANQYEVHYRVHSQDYGWLGWAKNGHSAGTQGFSKRLEAIEIKVVPKNTPLPSNNRTAFIKK